MHLNYSQMQQLNIDSDFSVDKHLFYKDASYNLMYCLFHCFVLINEARVCHITHHVILLTRLLVACCIVTGASGGDSTPSADTGGETVLTPDFSFGETKLQ